MRPCLPSLMFVALLAAPLQAQTCKPTAPPFLPDLFPEAVKGLPREFSLSPGSGCMALYRPADTSLRESQPWAVLSIEPNLKPATGASAEAARSTLVGLEHSILTVGDWPVGFATRPKGDEFVALKGSLKITLLIKNGDQGKASQALAIPFFEAILPTVPCG